MTVTLVNTKQTTGVKSAQKTRGVSRELRHVISVQWDKYLALDQHHKTIVICKVCPILNISSFLTLKM